MPVDACSQESLTAFNVLIRGHVLQAMMGSLGTSAMPFTHVVLLVCLTNLAFTLDRYSSMVREHSVSDAKVWAPLLVTFTTHAAHLPLCAEVLARLVFQCIGFSGWKEGVWIFSSVVFVISIAVFISSFVNHDVLLGLSRTSDGFLCCCV